MYDSIGKFNALELIADKDDFNDFILLQSQKVYGKIMSSNFEEVLFAKLLFSKFASAIEKNKLQTERLKPLKIKNSKQKNSRKDGYRGEGKQNLFA